MKSESWHARALCDGARRSREACSLRAEDHLFVVFVRRWKWWIIAACLLLLEVLVMETLGSTVGMHF